MGKKILNYLNEIESSKLLFLGYFSYIMLGALLLSVPFARDIDVPFLDNLFVSASAVSTTGLATVNIYESYNFFGQLVMFVLIQLGGLGYMTFGSFLILSKSKKMSKKREVILESSFSLPSHFRISKFIRSIVIYTFITEGIGAIFLYIIFKNDGRANPIWSAIFHSVSSFCTAGFSLYSDSFMTYASNPWLNVVVSILSILGAVGYIVMVDVVLVIRQKRDKITFTSKIILLMTFGLMIFGTVIMYITEPLIEGLGTFEKIQQSFFQTMSALTTVGFNTLPIGELSLGIIFLINILMVIGASPSGTGGGVKSTTVTAVFALLKTAVTKEKKVVSMNKVIPFERVISAVYNLILYIFILYIGVFLLSFTDGALGFEAVFFEATSALGTVGLSTGITGSLTSLGKIIIIILMFIGRIGPIGLGLAIFFRANKEKIELSEEDIVI